VFRYSPSSTVHASGTLRWTAPELLEEDAKNSRGSDVFAFGRVCYEIFSGHIPFYEITADGPLVKAIMNGKAYVETRASTISRGN